MGSWCNVGSDSGSLDALSEMVGDWCKLGTDSGSPDVLSGSSPVDELCG
eukprot:gene15505-biopygen17039